MIVGFTGTRVGLTADQVKQLWMLLQDKRQQLDIFIHGDAIGADYQASLVCRAVWPTTEITGFPCNITRQRGHSPVNDVNCIPEDPLDRNKKIVDGCGVLIACPYELRETPNGGTWYTIRYAKKKSKPLYIIYPNGSVEEHNVQS
jgi:hypothetical protein